MMKTINIILVTILSVILASCQTDGTHGTETFTLEDFKTVQLSDADTIKCDGMLLARPASILFHSDNFLLVADRKNVKLLHIIDLQDKSSRMVLHSGRTENELLAIWDMTLKGKDVYLSSIYESKLLKLHYIPENREFEFESSVRFSHQFMRCIPYYTGYLTLASASSKDRFYVWSDPANVVDTVGNFPTAGIIGDVPLHNGVLQSDISVYENKIVTSYKGIDYIDIYKDCSLSMRLRGPVLQDVEIKAKTFGNGAVRTSLSPDMFVFNRVIASDDGFWAGYVGYVSDGSDSPTPEKMRINKILHFTWDGKPDLAYTLDNGIEDFAIDTKSGVLYCLIENPEPGIISYSLY